MPRKLLPVATVVMLLLFTARSPADPVQQPETQATATPAQPATATPDPDALVCRTMPPKTGSLLGGRRECRTQREWDDIHQQNRREIEKMQDRTMMKPQ